jgi:uncharacterized protein
MFSASLQMLATTALGGAAGLLGGLFGVGGGAIAIPLLGLLYQLDQQTAQGTTLVMVVPNVLLGFWRYRQRVGVDLRIASASHFRLWRPLTRPPDLPPASTRAVCALPSQGFC